MKPLTNRIKDLTCVWNTHIYLERNFGPLAGITLLPDIIEELEQQIDYERLKVLDNEGH